MSKKTNKGFTLVELLVVIAIIAVMSIVVILTLNPAELLRQSRDSNRISDMATLKSAMSLYLADVNAPYLGTSTWCYQDVSAANAATAGTSSNSCNATFGNNPATNAVSNVASPRNVDGTGWIPVNFSKISSGAPFGQLPIDPLDNDALHLYLYKTSSTLLTFHIAVKMESAKYSYPSATNIEGTDGGTSLTEYEVGNNLSL